MIKITSTRGNINTNKDLNKKFSQLKESDDLEILVLSRLDLEKTRMRKKTNKGTDLGIVLDSKLQEGDVLDSDRFIFVKQSKELVLCVSLVKKPKDSGKLVDLLVFLGHTIGNRHRPISIEEEKILFPIHDRNEIQTFRNLFGDYTKNINLEVQERVFHPHKGMNVHEH